VELSPSVSLLLCTRRCTCWWPSCSWCCLSWVWKPASGQLTPPLSHHLSHHHLPHHHLSHHHLSHHHLSHHHLSHHHLSRHHLSPPHTALTPLTPPLTPRVTPPVTPNTVCSLSVCSACGMLPVFLAVQAVLCFSALVPSLQQHCKSWLLTNSLYLQHKLHIVPTALQAACGLQQH